MVFLLFYSRFSTLVSVGLLELSKSFVNSVLFFPTHQEIEVKVVELMAIPPKST
jgi:hypothetical protein